MEHLGQQTEPQFKPSLLISMALYRKGSLAARASPSEAFGALEAYVSASLHSTLTLNDIDKLCLLDRR
jgi:hypothetical protein